LAGSRIARPRIVALITGGTHDWIAANTDAVQTRVGLCTGVAIVAGGAIVLARLFTLSGRLIADADMTLVIELWI
jgi:hypothetical protein